MDLSVTIWKRTACSSRPIVPISSANPRVLSATVKMSRETTALAERDVARAAQCTGDSVSTTESQTQQKQMTLGFSWTFQHTVLL